MEQLKSLQQRLRSLQDHAKKLWRENYVKHNSHFLGVGVPQVRDELQQWYVRQGIAHLSDQQQLAMVAQLFSQKYAEEKMAAIFLLQLYLCHTMDWRPLLKTVETCFRHEWIHDWNISDWLCVKLLSLLIEKHGRPCASAIAQWNSAENLWQARCSVVAFVAHTRCPEYRSWLLSSSAILIRRPERFSKSAVGWIMREFSKHDLQLVIDFLHNYRLSLNREVVRNALKYYKTEQQKLLNDV